MSWSQNGIDFVCKKFGDSDECVVSGSLVFDYTDTQGISFSGVVGGTPDIVGFISLGLVESITMTTPSRPTISTPQTLLNTTNGSTVTLVDAQELTNHDENSGDQWCYSEPEQCTNPAGNEGQIDQCGDGGINQPKTTYKYECVDGQWVEGIENCPTCPDCAGCIEGAREIVEYCPDGTTVKSERICENGVWVYYDYTCPNGNCEGLSEAECNATTGCFWYQKYIWEEPKCHSTEQNMLMDYLPFIAVGGAGVIILVVLLSKRSPPQYYPPPPMYYPPPQYPNQRR